jgi:hypothetical protein
MLRIKPTTSSICCVELARARIVSLAVPAMPEARCTIVVASLTCVLIACTESPSWLAAVATV